MSLLDLYLDGRRAGEVVQHDSGKIVFRYDDEYREAPHATPLSLSMPLARQEHPQRVVRPFLQGLLPDSEGRLKELGREYGVSHNNPVALLEHVGSDAAGAVQLLRQHQESSDSAVRTGSIEWLSDRDFADLITDLKRNHQTWGTRTHAGRWSLPGAQPKVALFRGEDLRWGTPVDSTPTTHILKPSIEPYADHHFNEYMTMYAARALGLQVANDDVVRTVEGDAVFVSQRYDRKFAGGQWTRLHQEDICQALAVDPSQKYQADRGPGVKEIARLFGTFLHEADRVESSRRFFDALCFNVAMQGTDAHAKNYSLMLSGERVSLAPLYDLGSHAPYSLPAGQGVKLAMSIDGEYRLNAIGMQHLVRAAQTLGIDADIARARAQEILSTTPEAFSQAGDKARVLFGDDPFIATMIDSVAAYAAERGWLQ